MIQQLLTVLYAQPGKPNTDTIRCYGITELQYIASTLVQGKACDTNLSTTKAKLNIALEVNQELKFQNSKLATSDKINNRLYLKTQVERDHIQLKLDKQVRRNKIIKFCWGGTTVVLGTTILYLIFTH